LLCGKVGLADEGGLLGRRHVDERLQGGTTLRWRFEGQPSVVIQVVQVCGLDRALCPLMVKGIKRLRLDHQDRFSAG